MRNHYIDAKMTFVIIIQWNQPLFTKIQIAAAIDFPLSVCLSFSPSLSELHTIVDETRQQSKQ